MFTHQVIEDWYEIRERIFGKNEPSKGLLGMVQIIDPAIYYIKKSQKFYIGDCEIIYNKVVVKLNREIVGKIKWPYKIMYVEGTCSHDTLGKVSAVIYPLNTEPGYIFVPFQYIKTIEKGKWCPLGMFIKYYEETKMFQHVTVNDPEASEETISKLHNLADAILNITLATAMLLNCKNITTEKIPAPEALNKKRRKSGKQELFDYHVLNVVVPSEKRDYQEATTPLSHNRVHLCRGHFKEYTAEHPLFGHYTGLYWWQPHVRGQNKDGVVIKDYNVKL